MVAAVESAEAGRELARLLERVQQGERIVITLRGKPVAELAPVAEVPSLEPPSLEPVEQVISALRELRSRTQPTSAAEIREMINEGRP